MHVVLSYSYQYLQCNLSVADSKLHDFVRIVYGKEKCTPNMHMLHMHLSKSIHNYGPVTAFWCFTFERNMTYSPEELGITNNNWLNKLFPINKVC